MTSTLEQIEGQVRDKVDATVSQARRVFDVRHQVNERPWLALGAAVTAGYILGSLGGDDTPQPARPRPGEAMRYYAPDGGRGEEHRGEQPAQHVQHRLNPQPHETQHYEGRRFAAEGRGSQMGGVFAQIVDPLRHEIALITTAAVRSGMRALRESLRESIPQFESEYEAVQREHEDPEEGIARAVGATPGAMAPERPVGTSPGMATPAPRNDDPFRPR
jgi:hypothetical protein